MTDLEREISTQIRKDADLIRRMDATLHREDPATAGPLVDHAIHEAEQSEKLFFDPHA